ncbi:VG15 protein [Streptomyces bacillaris]|uniref:VG15 protein n=1 Tax=Streptomyces bacillaris TaxID=68179 RepID=UPI003807C9AF
MADEARAQALTELHARAQQELTGKALKRLEAAWRRVRVHDPYSVAQFLRQAEDVLAAAYAKSGRVSADYYQAHRRALLGETLFQSAEAAYAEARRVASRTAATESRRLSVQARRHINYLRKQGIPEADIQRLAGSRLLGQASRMVMSGGRDALAYYINNDPKVLGYQRRASVACCAFCAMLASRPNLYKTARSAGADGGRGFGRAFKAGNRTADAAPWHNGCRCVAVPVYSKKQRAPRNSPKFAEMWRRGEIEMRTSANGTAYPMFKQIGE